MNSNVNMMNMAGLNMAGLLNNQAMAMMQNPAFSGLMVPGAGSATAAGKLLPLTAPQRPQMPPNAGSNGPHPLFAQNPQQVPFQQHPRMANPGLGVPVDPMGAAHVMGHQLPHMGSQRPGMPRALSSHQVVSGPNKPAAFTGMPAPVLAPLPLSNNPLLSNSQGHTPQSAHQPQPTQPQKMASITPVIPQQQQPTPQTQPRLGSPKGPETLPGQKPEDQLQSELNTKIFKRNLGNAGVVRVLDLVDQVSNELFENLLNIDYWHRITQIYFIPTSILRVTTAPSPPLAAPPAQPDGSYLGPDFNVHRSGASRQFELNTSTAPRFFLATIVSGNVLRFQVLLPGLKFQVMNNGSIFIASRLTLNYDYADGSTATVSGTCKLLMNREFRIEWIDCHCLSHQSSISFGALERHWRAFSDRKLPHNPAENPNEFFHQLYAQSEAVKTTASSGIHDSAMRVMQIGDIMPHLRSLMGFSLVNNVSSPIKALELFMTLNNNQYLQRLNQAGPGSAPAGSKTSPSPHTLVNPDDPKMSIKKRKLSAVGGTNSPLVDGGLAKAQRRK